MPTTQFSRSFTFTRRNVPALCGMSGSIELKTPVMQLFMAHVRDSLTPGRQAVDVVGQVDLDHARRPDRW